MNINLALKAIEAFQGDSLTENLANLERSIVDHNSIGTADFCNDRNIDTDFIASAFAIKKVAGQINVIIHAAGILNSLPHILEEDEVVESVSLGAGNTGKKFDLETNLRVAEYKFITWQGGPESIRQNGVFKDFYELAEYETKKRKVLYVVNTHFPLKFFTGKRALSSVLAKQPEILNSIKAKYGSQMNVVRDFYELHKDAVAICDVGPFIGQ